MLDHSDLWQISPFSMLSPDKDKLFVELINELTQYHYSKCPEYKCMLDQLGFDSTQQYQLADLPFIPVRLFKDNELLSCDRSDVVKTMTSSGTTGQRVSKIYLDRTNSRDQTKALAQIMSDITGGQRRPMLVIDSKSVVGNRSQFSARGAGILGFSMFGRDITYALDDDMKLDYRAVSEFCEKYTDTPTLIFGFTSIVWQNFCRVLESDRRTLDLSSGVLVHGGGWKKLASLDINHNSFNQALDELCQIKRVCNYYGMVEQTGSIFIECEQGHLHSSIFSEILIRRPDFSLCDMGEEGAVQVISWLPSSYPGHNLLTEDAGTILGVDDCACGRKGKYFSIKGRILNAEVRGCSDTYNQD